MARGGVYKSEVEKVRKQLLSKGKRPTVALVRETLGTGSYATIHRLLKEVEAEDPAGRSLAYPVSDAIADLASRLAGRLQEEAQEELATARAQFEADLAERDAQLKQRKSESEQHSAAIQRLETALHSERTEHATTGQALTEARAVIQQLEERIAGLTTRLEEHEAHAKSLESKHQQAREALEHFRVASKEQREHEQRRHEHQVQTLQAELRQVAETTAQKNEEALRLNRDNARLAEQVSRQDKELHDLRAEARERDHELKVLRPITADHKALQTRCAHAEAQAQALKSELAAVRDELARERELGVRIALTTERTTNQNANLEALIAKLTLAVDKTSGRDHSATATQTAR